MFVLQALQHLLQTNSPMLQQVFASLAQPDPLQPPASPGACPRGRYSLLPFSHLPNLMCMLLPSCSPEVIDYCVFQLTNHLNVVMLGSAAGYSHDQASTQLLQPADLMYAELAAALIASGDAEAAVAAGQLSEEMQHLLLSVEQILSSAEGLTIVTSLAEELVDEQGCVACFITWLGVLVMFSV